MITYNDLSDKVVELLFSRIWHFIAQLLRRSRRQFEELFVAALKPGHLHLFASSIASSIHVSINRSIYLDRVSRVFLSVIQYLYVCYCWCCYCLLRELFSRRFCLSLRDHYTHFRWTDFTGDLLPIIQSELFLIDLYFFIYSTII